MNAAVGHLLLLIAVGVSSEAVSRATDQSPISITISSPKDNWRVGSDVVVTINLMNISDQTVLFRKSFAQDKGELFIDVEVRDDQGNPLPRTKYYRVLRQEDNYDFERQPNGELTMQVAGGGSMQKKSLTPGETLKDGVVVNRLFDLSRLASILYAYNGVMNAPSR